ncbi:MAG: BamA/TamA family outer membrane protein [Gemmatimonadetes bacterium]|nr:BamA/TamA family outer membrane protein [Gemmatimonadota bacterium]MYA40400.1 BamA/TamA family outer membrane protein [Gemmatimonadota bacterium]MYE95218.1 BamA/TamA family outer membrane protein [Gemmatimonadota bacterium]MYJ09051.1 BamA/TamA family outer membrane protein [Gemmatimonadota bacterium]
MNRQTGHGRFLQPTVVALAAICLVSALPLQAQTTPPNEEWREFPTDHFVVTYPARLGDLATRAAALAERAYTVLAERFVDTPAVPVQLLLTDHADIANGFASPNPYNRITIFARPPTDGGSISYFDDWLELVITHELVHTFHLDMTGALGNVVRKVFGRVPAVWPVFPSGATPTWLTEGLATYFESHLTGAGRVKGTWQEMVMRTNALEGSPGTLDQVSGHSPVWPAGHRPYVYGARYLAHMAEAYGEQSMGDYARAVAGLWVPFRLNSAARDAFGTTVSDSWEVWQNHMAAVYAAEAEALAAVAPITEGETVEGSGRLAEQAMVSPDGERLAFVRSDGVDATQIRVSSPDGSNARRLTRVNGVGGTLSWMPDGGVLFSQLDFTDPYRLTSDLYRAAPDGTVSRLTRGQRVTYADVSPDGSRAVAVQEGGGTNNLVIVDLATGEVTPLMDPQADRHWAYPRWSPAGGRIVAVRWVAPAFMDIVVLDESGSVTVELTHDRAVDTTPFWTPDGSSVIWSSDRTGIPNLFAATLHADSSATIRQVTNVLGGASHPSVDPASRWIHYSSYHADGWHIERIPYAPGDWFEPQATSPRFAGRPIRFDGAFEPTTPGPTEAEASTPAYGLDEGTGRPAGERSYRAGSTLLPRYWLPLYTRAEEGTDQDGVRREVFDQTVGMRLVGRDLVGRHSYSIAGRVGLNDRRFGGGFSYNYNGFGNPTLGLSVSQSHDASSRTLSVRFPDDSTREFFLIERERRAFLSTSFLRRRYRTSTALYVRGGVVREELSLQDPNGNEGPTLSSPAPRTSYTELSATLSAANTQRRAMSFSREDGLRGFVTARMRRQRGVDAVDRGVIGADRGYGEISGELSAYKALGRLGFANHVLGLRFSAGAAAGPGANQFHFDAGGAEGTVESVTGLGLFGGSPRLFPVRGYRSNYRSGRIAWTGSVEYRFPLAVIDRGLGLFPLFFDRMHGAVFADAGNAWGPTLDRTGYDNPRRAMLASVGAELSVIVGALYLPGTTIRAGVGLPLRFEDDPVFHVRVGNSF